MHLKYHLPWSKYCIYTFRGHPRIRKLDMMHATDYANMDLAELQRNIEANKKKDKQLTKVVQ